MTKLEELEDEYVFLMMAGRNDDAQIISDMIDEAGTEPKSAPVTSDYQPKSKDIMTPFLKGASFNLSDEIIGGVAATYMKIMNTLSGDDKPDMFGNQPATFQENYATARDQERADQAAFAEANPKADLAIQLAGGLTSGGYGATKAMGSSAIANASKAQKLAAASGIGAAEGAAFGFGEGEGEDSLRQAGTSAVLGAAMTPAITAVANKVVKPFMQGPGKRMLDRLKKTHTAESLEIEAGQFYNEAAKSGIKVKPAPFIKFREKLIDDLKKEGLDVNVNPKNPAEMQVSKIIRRMLTTDEPTYKELMAMRDLLKAGKKSTDGATSKYSHEVSNIFDDFVGDLSPTDISAGTVENLTDNLKKAKDYWHRSAQATTLKDMSENALISEAFVKDRDFDAAMRSEIKSLIKSPRKRYGMDKDALTDLRTMITGTRKKNIVRTGARVDPGSSTRRGPIPATGSALSGAAIYMATGSAPMAFAASIVPLVPPAIGAGFKGIANKLTRKEFAAIENAIINKGQPALEEMIESLISKYTTGASAAIAGQGAGAASTELNDMITP